MSATIQTRLVNYLKAGFPGIAIQTTEESRAVSDALEAAKTVKKNVLTWSATEGAREVHPTPKELPDTQDLSAACSLRREDTLYILRDAHTWPIDRDPLLARSLRDLLQWAPTKGSGVVFIGPEFKPHPTFEKLVTVTDYTLPSPEDLARVCTGIAESAGKKLTAGEDVIRALGGLSTPEAENALALSLIETKKFSPDVIYREKVQAVRKTGLLDIIEPDPRGLEAIGGLENLKSWVVRRKRAYSKEAKEFGLPTPKGVILVGVPGTGKSLSAKAIGTALGIPTLRWDIGSAFNSLVGASEARTRDTLELAGAISPCVLWIDEIDKGLAGAGGSGSGDSGVTRRVFGTLISWMQERKKPVFVVATANQVEHLPPELLRKGRFDEIFAIDLPSAEERQEIFRIQLERRGRKFDLSNGRGLNVVNATEGFTGSEIETIIDEAMFCAFEADRELCLEDLCAAVSVTVPLSATAKEQIDKIREWARTRARFASTRAQQPSTPATVRRLVSQE